MTEEPSVGMSRRRFLKIGAFAGAGLTVGIYLGTGGERRKSQTEVWSDHKGHFKPNAWVCIGQDESVIVRVNHTEMGQGITTALAMIVAEELDADWANVRVDMAPAEALYKNPAFNCQMTAAAFLSRNPEPTDAQIDEAMSGVLCRCGTYPAVRNAIHRAARRLQP
jgi:isoquinoline 1-oxidoreductase beta subunit